MKKLQMVLMVLVISSTSSCWDDGHNNPIVGTWEMTSTKVDPGNGSGKWLTPLSAQRVSFTNDGRVDFFGDYLDNPQTRYEILIPDSVVAVFSPDHTSYSKFVYHIRDNEFYLRAGCYEGCEYKYRKIFKLTP